MQISSQSTHTQNIVALWYYEWDGTEDKQWRFPLLLCFIKKWSMASLSLLICWRK